jgi:ABC-type dipeptide/oligopeptide/nickel transport system permease component
MLPYLARRLLESAVLLLGVLILVFFLVRLTGDPVSLILPMDATVQQRAAMREVMGLERPVWIQLRDYLGNAARGDLGTSLRRRGEANVDLIAARLGATVTLALSALAFALALALPLGLAAGLRPGGVADACARTVGLLGQTIPSFAWGMILIVVFAVELRLLPSFGRGGWDSLVLPTIALGLAGAGQLTRLTRSVVLDVRAADYIRTARAKGLAATRVALTHVLPNAAIPIVSVLGVQFTYLLGGSVYIEVVFAWPGLGTLLEGAVRDADFPLVQAITVFFALAALTVHFVTDLAYGLLDPRVRMVA